MKKNYFYIITLLAFSDKEHIDNSKIMILVSSLVAGILGFVYLKSLLKKIHLEEYIESDETT